MGRCLVGGETGRVEEGALTEAGEYLAEIWLCDPAILVVVDELEGLLELLDLRGLEEGKETGCLPSWSHRGGWGRGDSGVGRGGRTWQERRSPGVLARGLACLGV